MARSKYSIEQKKKFIMAFREQTGSTTRLNAEEIASWCNRTYHLADELHGYDFRRPAEMKEWFDQINRNIEFTVETEEGIIRVVTGSLIDIDFAVRNATDTNKLRSVLRSANMRFGEVIETNQKLAEELKSERERRSCAERDLGIYKTNNEKLRAELNKAKKEAKRAVKAGKSEGRDARRICTKLLEYIQKYIYDPAMADHLANDLLFLKTEDGRPVEVPESFRKFFHDGCTDSESMMRFAQWVSEGEDICGEEEDWMEDGEDEDCDGDEDNEGVTEQPMLLSQAESKALQMLDELEGM